MKLIEFKNEYWKKDNDSFIKLFSLVKKYPNSYHIRLQFEKYGNIELKEYIDQCIPDAIHGFKISLKTKIYMVFNGLYDFPKCHECGKLILKQVTDTTKGFNCHKNSHFIFCSKECHYKNADEKELCSYSNKIRFLDEEYRKNFAKQRKTSMLLKYGSETYNVEQCRKSMLQKYGLSCTFKIDSVKDKISKTLKRKYGNDICNVFQSSQVKQKIKESNLKRFGVAHPSSLKQTREKAMRTTIERYGTYAISHKYEYDGKSFDSSWELAYYIWLKDNHIEFKYPSGISYEYLIDGIVHHYFPDFIVNGQVIEIKGKQFLDENGKLTCPFVKNITDKNKLKDLLEEYEAKQKCIEQNNVKVLSEKDLKMAFEHIMEKYKVKNYMSFCNKYKSK